MDGRGRREHLHERLGVVACERRGVERPDALADLERSREGGLHRHLLIEQHADEERERIVGEELVGRGVARDVQSHALSLPPDAQPGDARMDA